ncbi:MarR family transcriptional regulator [Variovorax sp. dw_954]|uniref:MarR family winged helix-turn-helix transcriptional regulator n=1 Tax=Variovorax sp. dw_954 TaxID=2720078 RepID=UPI001BD1EE4B|nr:MarR family transcriptional regulator [Variovorax sp. dw_954]
MSRPAIDFLTFRMDVVNDQAKQMASAIYEEACDVSLRELRVLRLAHRQPGITQGEVSSKARLEKTLVSKLVTSLARRELLVRQIGTEDARWVQLHLTASGREIVKQCDRLGRKMEKSLLSVLSSEEVEVFEACLAKLAVQVESGFDVSARKVSR